METEREEEEEKEIEGCIVARSVQSDSASLQRQTLKPSFMRPLHTIVLSQNPPFPYYWAKL
jgi:hypothetical protein